MLKFGRNFSFFFIIFWIFIDISGIRNFKALPNTIRVELESSQNILISYQKIEMLYQILRFHDIIRKIIKKMKIFFQISTLIEISKMFSQRKCKVLENLNKLGKILKIRKKMRFQDIIQNFEIFNKIIANFFSRDKNVKLFMKLRFFVFQFWYFQNFTQFVQIFKNVFQISILRLSKNVSKKFVFFFRILWIFRDTVPGIRNFKTLPNAIRTRIFAKYPSYISIIIFFFQVHIFLYLLKKW
mgnify:CR=1 FL=1